jgi:Concanavalin A-like lectin/glucanases superfamily
MTYSQLVLQRPPPMKNILTNQIHNPAPQPSSADGSARKIINPLITGATITSDCKIEAGVAAVSPKDTLIQATHTFKNGTDYRYVVPPDFNMSINLVTNMTDSQNRFTLGCLLQLPMWPKANPAAVPIGKLLYLNFKNFDKYASCRIFFNSDGIDEDMYYANSFDLDNGTAQGYRGICEPRLTSTRFDPLPISFIKGSVGTIGFKIVSIDTVKGRVIWEIIEGRFDSAHEYIDESSPRYRIAPPGPGVRPVNAVLSREYSSGYTTIDQPLGNNGDKLNYRLMDKWLSTSDLLLNGCNNDVDSNMSIRGVLVFTGMGIYEFLTYSQLIAQIKASDPELLATPKAPQSTVIDFSTYSMQTNRSVLPAAHYPVGVYDQFKLLAGAHYLYNFQAQATRDPVPLVPNTPITCKCVRVKILGVGSNSYVMSLQEDVMQRIALTSICLLDAAGNQVATADHFTTDAQPGAIWGYKNMSDGLLYGSQFDSVYGYFNALANTSVSYSRDVGIYRATIDDSAPYDVVNGNDVYPLKPHSNSLTGMYIAYPIPTKTELTTAAPLKSLALNDYNAFFIEFSVKLSAGVAEQVFCIGTSPTAPVGEYISIRTTNGSASRTCTITFHGVVLSTTIPNAGTTFTTFTLIGNYNAGLVVFVNGTRAGLIVHAPYYYLTLNNTSPLYIFVGAAGVATSTAPLMGYGAAGAGARIGSLFACFGGNVIPNISFTNTPTIPVVSIEERINTLRTSTTTNYVPNSPQYPAIASFTHNSGEWDSDGTSKNYGKGQWKASLYGLMLADLPCAVNGQIYVDIKRMNGESFTFSSTKVRMLSDYVDVENTGAVSYSPCRGLQVEYCVDDPRMNPSAKFIPCSKVIVDTMAASTSIYTQSYEQTLPNYTMTPYARIPFLSSVSATSESPRAWFQLPEQPKEGDTLTLNIPPQRALSLLLGNEKILDLAVLGNSSTAVQGAPYKSVSLTNSSSTVTARIQITYMLLPPDQSGNPQGKGWMVDSQGQVTLYVMSQNVTSGSNGLVATLWRADRYATAVLLPTVGAATNTTTRIKNFLHQFPLDNFFAWCPDDTTKLAEAPPKATGMYDVFADNPYLITPRAAFRYSGGTPPAEDTTSSFGNPSTSTDMVSFTPQVRFNGVNVTTGFLHIKLLTYSDLSFKFPYWKAQDFSFDFWLKDTGAQNAFSGVFSLVSNGVTFDAYPNNTAPYYVLRKSSTTTSTHTYKALPANTTVNGGATYTSANVFVHYHVRRENTSLRVYRDGVLLDSATLGYYDSFTDLFIGSDPSYTYGFSGIIGGVVLSQGVNFRPTTFSKPNMATAVMDAYAAIKSANIAALGSFFKKSNLCLAGRTLANHSIFTTANTASYYEATKPLVVVPSFSKGLPVIYHQMDFYPPTGANTGSYFFDVAVKLGTGELSDTSMTGLVSVIKSAYTSNAPNSFSNPLHNNVLCYEDGEYIGRMNASLRIYLVGKRGLLVSTGDTYTTSTGQDVFYEPNALPSTETWGSAYHRVQFRGCTSGVARVYVSGRYTREIGGVPTTAAFMRRIFTFPLPGQFATRTSQIQYQMYAFGSYNVPQLSNLMASKGVYVPSLPQPELAYKIEEVPLLIGEFRDSAINAYSTNLTGLEVPGDEYFLDYNQTNLKKTTADTYYI